MRVKFRIQGNNGSLWCRSNSRLSEFEPLLTATRRPLWNQHGYTNVIKPFGFSLFYETKFVSQFDHTYIDSVVFVTLLNWFCMLVVNIVALVCGLVGWLLCVFLLVVWLVYDRRPIVGNWMLVDEASSWQMQGRKCIHCDTGCRPLVEADSHCRHWRANGITATTKRKEEYIY